MTVTDFQPGQRVWWLYAFRGAKAGAVQRIPAEVEGRTPGFVVIVVGRHHVAKGPENVRRLVRPESLELRGAP